MDAKRRNFILAGLGFGGFIALQFLSGKATPLYRRGADVVMLQLSDEEWRRRLSTDAYQVLRKGKTEIRASSALNREWRAGTYCCRGCDLNLFTSTMKYESNTGWPSFYDHIKGHLETYTDLYAVPPQRAYRCARCGGHHGHLFMDGPLPTGERWCNNGLALKFAPA